jgi:hypothetical protein
VWYVPAKWSGWHPLSWEADTDNEMLSSIPVQSLVHLLLALQNGIFFSHSGGWSPYWVHSARRPLQAYCTCPRWLWWWRIWWNEDWQGKPKYLDKTCPSATLSTTNPTCQTRARTRAAAVGSQRLTAYKTVSFHHHGYSCTFSSSYLILYFTPDLKLKKSSRCDYLSTKLRVKVWRYLSMQS